MWLVCRSMLLNVLENGITQQPTMFAWVGAEEAKRRIVNFTDTPIFYIGKQEISFIKMWDY